MLRKDVGFDMCTNSEGGIIQVIKLEKTKYHLQHSVDWRSGRIRGFSDYPREVQGR